MFEKYFFIFFKYTPYFLKPGEKFFFIFFKYNYYFLTFFLYPLYVNEEVV